MSYIHCYKCGWDNDDFLTDYGGNKGMLTRIFKWDLKNVIISDYTAHVKNKRLVALRHAWEDIKRMYFLNFQQKYKTYEQFKKENPNRLCPKCGTGNLDID
jgi:hypothetical protein